MNLFLCQDMIALSESLVEEREDRGVLRRLCAGGLCQGVQHSIASLESWVDKSWRCIISILEECLSYDVRDWVSLMAPGRL